MYDQREKAIQNFEWSLAGARDEVMEKGRLEGREVGLIIRQIQVIQGLLEESPDALEALMRESMSELSMRLESLRSQLQNRAGMSISIRKVGSFYYSALSAEQ